MENRGKTAAIEMRYDICEKVDFCQRLLIVALIIKEFDMNSGY